MREIRCIGCGQLNRIPRYSVYRIPRCATCKTQLPEPPLITIARTVYTFRGRYLLALGVIAGIAGALVLGRLPPTRPQAATPTTDLAKSAPAPVEPIKPVDSCAALPQPEQGVYATYLGAPDPDAVISIKADTGANYFVLLRDAATNARVMSFYVLGGGTVQASVPIGRYVLHYASGASWCGSDTALNPFGGKTKTNVFGLRNSPHILDFPPGYRSEHDVELVLDLTGNVPTESIPPDQF